MRRAHDLERSVGIEYYVSETDGTGGRLRDRPADFRVKERERFATEASDADPGDYPWLVVRATLRGMDTNDFAREFANRVGISRERVTWAGTKDKDAVTTQLFSVRDLDPDEVPTLSKAEIEVVGRSGRGLQFGDLLGNEFEIVVRDASRPDGAGAVTTELEEFGGGTPAVPNYFGQQRFGSYRPVTHEVGLAVVRGDWEGAVMAYLGNPSEYEPEGSQEARRFVEETRDWEAALDRFPRRLRYERTMLHSLVETGGRAPEDFRTALETFPENVQRLFVNAAQSYAFNRMLSERLERGLPFHEPVAGDVACFADTDAPDAFVLPDVDREQRVSADRVDVVGRHCRRNRAFVTAPLVGTETELADGEQGEIEREVLAELDLVPEDFDLPGAFGSRGTRRAILLPFDPTIEHEPLTLSFTLPKGSYATVVLREFLKTGPLDL
ncbi:tRNA pseudouridine(13) synthase TruD [Halanaeroarchaeum sulfurireducens]|uniref:Probable tRNA pseudouridine synthase D n=1 Tax=Halanaeroarchaeum sulfurireducens TaxID=1604004 RepID=A0A0F7P787_9EURY|nr:tRNA pseudouridine(13) synthase TruD [Halanaeroarchaeum sulfurireducens]AKH97071.1 tRNA pseudouridine synthase D [Halanaeroarchaeum sulfurireducens]